MAKKVSEYTTAATVLASGDLFDLTKLVSTGPDVYESQRANANLLAGWNLFGQDQTMPAPRLHNLSNNQLSLTNGRLLLKGSDNIGTDLLKLESLAGTEVFKALNNGTIKISNAFTLPVADGTAGQALLTDGAGAVSFGNVAGAGVFGISDVNGVYTYYTTIELALSAASNGDTIEQFSNVSVSTSTSITLDKDITWNMNGYEYKNTSTSVFNMLEIPGNTTVKLTINNGYIKRNTGSTNGGTLLDTGNFLTSEIISNGVIYENIEGTVADGYSKLIGGIFRSSSTTNIGFDYNGSVNNIKVFSFNGNKVQSSSSVVEIFNSTFYSENSDNTLNGINAYNSNFTSDGGNGLKFGVGTNKAYNCTATSTSAVGIFCFNTELHNCSAFSSANIGIRFSDANSVAYNSIGKSTAGNGFYFVTGARAYNCFAESSANAGVRFGGGGIFKNGIAKSTGTSIYSQAVFCDSSNFEVTNCNLIVTTASNNCIKGQGSQSGKLANNSYKGSTVAVNSNITNSITNTQDSQGNILI